MRASRICNRLGVALGLALLFVALPTRAQNARLNLEHLDKLSDKAVEVNNVTLDGDMLQLAAKFLDMDKDDPEDTAEAKELLKKLKGIYVKNFEFDEPNQYSQADVQEIRTQLAAPGWSKVVESRDKRSNENDEIYVMKGPNNTVAGIAILVAEPKELTVVNLVGAVDIDKLSALAGKFGIPASEEKPKDKEKDKEHHKKKATAENSNDKS